MGSAPSCPSGMTLVADLCRGPCPTGSTSPADYPNVCVSTVPCPTGTANDFTGLQCDKTTQGAGIVPATNNACPQGYTQWTTGYCYIDCSVQFLENGLSCIKKSVVRDSAQPVCTTFLTTYANGACNMDWLLFVILFVGIMLLLRYYYFTYVKKKEA